MTPVSAKILKKFDPKTFLSTIDGGRKITAFLKKQTIFVQGDSADVHTSLHTKLPSAHSELSKGGRP